VFWGGAAGGVQQFRKILSGWGWDNSKFMNPLKNGPPWKSPPPPIALTSFWHPALWFTVVFATF
jgi:hypothetical protein